MHRTCSVRVRMDELRCEIWDFLYRMNQPQSLETIARHVPGDAQMICAAIDHEWFEVNHDVVVIARMGQVKNETHNKSDRT